MKDVRVANIHSYRQCIEIYGKSGVPRVKKRTYLPTYLIFLQLLVDVSFIFWWICHLIFWWMCHLIFDKCVPHNFSWMRLRQFLGDVSFTFNL